MRAALSYVVLAGLGAIAALVGAGSHRAYPIAGLVLCLAMIALASVFARAWRGFAGIAVLGAAWAIVTIPLAMEGPGGSFLVVEDALGLTWVFGGAALIAAAAVVPGRLLTGGPDVR
ncbi:hypothetical protein [Demequina pelophila]|uniref:hypothetical protein n=1 Tax=Demequina pelophila TaxID=1638984 RepID=UPI00078215E8|nr:hypothetical protein [Demequina pelophila]